MRVYYLFLFLLLPVFFCGCRTGTRLLPDGEKYIYRGENKIY